MPIKEDLKTIGYEFAYNVHGQEGVNKWMLVASDAKSRAESEKATIDKLVSATYEYFRTQPTVYPEMWVRILITKGARKGESMLDEKEFSIAFDSLMRC